MTTKELIKHHEAAAEVLEAIRFYRTESVKIFANSVNTMHLWPYNYIELRQTKLAALDRTISILKIRYSNILNSINNVNLV